MLRIATPVVKAVFDTEFDPNQLKSGQIFKRNDIEKLVKQKHLTEKDRDIVLPVTRMLIYTFDYICSTYLSPCKYVRYLSLKTGVR